MPKKKSGVKTSGESCGGGAKTSEKRPSSSSNSAKQKMPGEILVEKCVEPKTNTESEKPTSSLHEKLLLIKKKKKVTKKKSESETGQRETCEEKTVKIKTDKEEVKNEEEKKQTWDINGWRDAVNKPKNPTVLQESVKSEKKSDEPVVHPVRKVGLNEKEKERIRNYLKSGPFCFLTTMKKSVPKNEEEPKEETPKPSEETKSLKEEQSSLKGSEETVISTEEKVTCIESTRDALETLKISDTSIEKKPQTKKESISPKLEKFINSKLKKQKSKENESENKEEKKKKVECCDMESFVTPLSELSSSSLDSSASFVKKNADYLPAPNVIEFFRKKGDEWKQVGNKLFDSHCHFDFLFAKSILTHFKNLS